MNNLNSHLLGQGKNDIKIMGGPMIELQIGKLTQRVKLDSLIIQILAIISCNLLNRPISKSPFLLPKTVNNLIDKETQKFRSVL